MGNEILLYFPNQIGYVRLLLLVGSLLAYDYPLIFLAQYIISVALDGNDFYRCSETHWRFWDIMGIDGYVARKYNQTSDFGAWFDVVIDLISRGALWCFISKWGYFVMMVEWLCFVATHARGANWKIPEEEFPAITKMVMAKGFKTPIGTYAITGLFTLPLWLYGMTTGFLDQYIGLPIHIQLVLLVFLIGGRVLAMTAELFFIQQHIKHLLNVPNTPPTNVTTESNSPQKRSHVGNKS